MFFFKAELYDCCVTAVRAVLAVENYKVPEDLIAEVKIGVDDLSSKVGTRFALERKSVRVVQFAEQPPRQHIVNSLIVIKEATGDGMNILQAFKYINSKLGDNEGQTNGPYFLLSISAPLPNCPTRSSSQKSSSDFLPASSCILHRGEMLQTFRPFSLWTTFMQHCGLFSPSWRKQRSLSRSKQRTR